MLHRRLYQFLLVYAGGLGVLFAIKFLLGLSDYVIPGPQDIWHAGGRIFGAYFLAVVDTLRVAIVGQMIAVFMASVVGIIGRQNTWAGSLIKVAAFNIQAYPIVAVAPIIFILLGDGLSSRLLIAAMICYFPLLLSFIGVFSEPVESIEHFYTATRRMNWQLQVKIRAFENMNKLATVIAGSATLAMVGTIVAEFIAANAGIGYSIRRALYQSDLSQILVALFLIGIFTSLYLAGLEGIGAWVQRRLQQPQRPSRKE
jgi:NitT/TauT family transport system permease protein